MISIKTQAVPILQAMWRRKWLGVGVAWLVCAIGWVGVAFIATKYESSARVYLNADPLLTPLLHGLAADTNPTRQLDFLQRTLLSRQNMEELGRLTDLDAGLNEPAQKDALYKRLASAIDIRPITPNLMAISYRDHDPQLAKNVVQSLLTIFAERTTGSSRTDMDNAQRFLDEEIASYRDKLRAAERRRADLAQQYPDIVSDRSPGAPVADDARSRVEQTRDALARAQGDLDDTLAKREALRKQLASVPPMLSVDRAPQVVMAGGKMMSSSDAQLAQLRSNLDTLRLKYTDKHPDVIAARAAIRDFEDEMKRSGPGEDGPGKTQIPNNVYDQLKIRLADVDTAVATAQRHLAAAQAAEQHVERIARAAPDALAEAQDLDRDYGVLRKNYEELVARRQATQIADAADTKTEKIQFRVVDPPQVPVVPVQPNRAFLLSVVLLLGFGAGFAAPLAMIQLDQSFATIAQLRELGIPILGSVTRLSLGADRRRETIQLAGVCAGAFVLIAVYGTLMALNLSPHSPGVS